MKHKWIKAGLILALATSIMACPPAEKKKGDKKEETKEDSRFIYEQDAETEVAIAAPEKIDYSQVNFLDDDKFEFLAEKFADLKIIRYQIPQWDKLSLQQKKLVYYLSQAGYSGRDIMYDQNYRHNLAIRRALEKIITNYDGDKESEDFKALELYLKRMWFSNGIHHHYANDKFKPSFSREFLAEALKKVGAELNEEAMKAIFDNSFDAKKVNLDTEKGLVKGSAVNFYAPELTETDVDAFYEGLIDKDDKTPVEYGLNSKLIVTEDGKIKEDVYEIGGRYTKALEKVAYWLGEAQKVAENDAQAKALGLLIEYYKTGDLEKWSEYNIAWAGATEGDIDYINGFVEVYNDSKGYRGSYETIVEIKDFEMSERMKVVADNAQYFEDNSTIMDEHKKKEVKGVSYKVVNVAGESGDASPSTPIGVNLPNSNWIRSTHGSKSVSLGNIIYAYDQAGGKGILTEFAHDKEEIERSKKHSKVAGKMHTALHEVIGHASGQINDGIGTPKETLKNYASTLEEARADLVGLYYIMDQKLIDLGLVESDEVGKAEYDGYIRNGMMSQLVRLELGADIEEAHMRNRQLVASWAFEKGANDNVIEKITKDGKTYFNITDYDRLRSLFGELLREIQRIKSEGDYEAGKKLVETYGVKVDQALHKEVLDRKAKLDITPYGGFMNPVLEPVMDENGEITDIKVKYMDSFKEQMLFYAKNYSFLPDYN